MSEELNKLLIKAYILYEKDSDPPVPLKAIKEYLHLEGIEVDSNG